jgi:hypothetical protein
MIENDEGEVQAQCHNALGNMAVRCGRNRYVLSSLQKDIFTSIWSRTPHLVEVNFVFQNKCLNRVRRWSGWKTGLLRIDTTPDERRNFTRRSSQGHTFEVLAIAGCPPFAVSVSASENQTPPTLNHHNQGIIGCITILSEARLQETFRLGDICPDLRKKLDRLHFGIIRAGEQPPGKERAECMVNRLGIIGFLSTKLLPDCGIEHLYACGLAHFLGRSTVGWSNRNFSRMAAVCEFGDRRPSSQLRSDGKVA